MRAPWHWRLYVIRYWQAGWHHPLNKVDADGLRRQRRSKPWQPQLILIVIHELD
jgi:hypothetical protein